MPTLPDHRSARANYHHGDLRRVLIDTALTLLSEEGNWTFTLRELARRADVSHTAPYRHFLDKRDLLAEVAAMGFETLTEAMQRAAVDLPGSPAAQFRALGLAYGRFGVEHAAHYRLMFGAEFAADRSRYPRLNDAAEAAFGVLVTGLHQCATAGLVRSGSIEEQARVAWAVVHGLTLLVIDRWVAAEGETESAEALAQAATAALFHGLAIPNSLPARG